MESKVLTALQEKVLTGLFDHGLGKQGYYLTGGTALAEFYLQHRYSDDLDFFTRKQIALEKEIKNLTEILTDMGLVIDPQSVTTDLVRLFVHPEDQPDNQLKIEFVARDMAAMMDQPTIRGQIVVDSFEDIAVNKVCAILGRQEPKDFCDLFFILNESRFSLKYLIGRAREKDAAFDTEEGELAFATNLRDEVRKFKKLPRMIKPLSLDELKTYFIPIAEQIIQRLRPRGG